MFSSAAALLLFFFGDCPGRRATNALTGLSLRLRPGTLNVLRLLFQLSHWALILWRIGLVLWVLLDGFASFPCDWSRSLDGLRPPLRANLGMASTSWARLGIEMLRSLNETSRTSRITLGLFSLPTSPTLFVSSSQDFSLHFFGDFAGAGELVDTTATGSTSAWFKVDRVFIFHYTFVYIIHI